MSFLKKLFKRDRADIKCVYAGPMPPEEPPIAPVYAGPMPRRQSKDNIYAGVYAGPMPRSQSKDNIYADVYAGPMPSQVSEDDDMVPYPANHQMPDEASSDSDGDIV